MYNQEKIASRQERVQEAIREITTKWSNEEPFVNLEKPFPLSDSENFCWYDLTEEWREDRIPQRVDNVDWRLNFGKDGFVNLPFAEQQSKRNELIEAALLSFSKGVHDLWHLEEGINTYWKGDKPFETAALRRMFKSQSAEECSEHLNTITKIAGIALRSKHLITKPLPIITAKGAVKSVSMSQEQAAVLLAHCFFCTFLHKENDDRATMKPKWLFSFQNIHCGIMPIYIEKLKFILSYFKTVSEEMPRGTLTYSRQACDSAKKDYENWEERLSDVIATGDGLIEDMTGCLEVDFANKFIGGGVMNTGAVQEEIRFMCCPEMLVSLILFKRTEPHEAILIQGAQQYSNYTGFSNKTRHVPMTFPRDERRDRFGRARNYLVAIDAVNVGGKRQKQYERELIEREIRKTYAGFMCVDEDAPTRPIATGNWGCGAFGGDPELKSLIQLVAASRASRTMIYSSFKDEKFAERLEEVVNVLKSLRVTDGQLFTLLTQYEKGRKVNEGVFDFVRRSVHA